MKQVFLIIFILTSLSFRCFAAVSLSDDQATQETRELYEKLYENRWRDVKFGMQSAYSEGIGWNARTDGFNGSDIERVSGKKPGVVGFDFRETLNWPQSFYEQTLKEVKAAHKDGAIITFSWHALNPRTKGSFYDKTPATHLLLRSSEAQKNFYKKLDLIAKFAHDAVDEQGKLIPIIFRPFHEHNGRWFWWHHSIYDCNDSCTNRQRANAERRGSQDFKALWRLVFNYLKTTKNVHNFIYAWSPAAFQNKGYFWRYPGDNYVDILGLDAYRPTLLEFLTPLNQMINEAKKRNKVSALTETGDEGVPNPEYWTKSILTPIKKNLNLKHLSYIMVWRNSFRKPEHHFGPFPGHASSEDFINFINDPFVVMGGDF